MSTSTGELEGASALPEQGANQVANAGNQEQMVPVHVVQSMRDELRALKENNDALKNHLSMMQWNQPVQQPVQAAQSNPFEGRDPNDPLTIQEGMRAFAQLQSQYENKFNELKTTAQNPDFDEVIKTYLPKASQEDPSLLDDIRRSPNPYRAAYMAAKASKAYQDDLVAKYKTPPNQPNPEVAKMVANSKQSGSLASVGNSSSVNSSPKYSQMTDDEFRQIKARNMMKAGRPT